MANPPDSFELKAIELYALYGTPAGVYKEMRTEFGDNSPTYAQILKIRQRFRKEIIKKREALVATIPILDSKERFAYLQQILDGALEGEIVYDKNGFPVEAKIDRPTALNALKIAYDQTQAKGVVVPDEDENMIRSIVESAYEDLKKRNPNKSNKELLDYMIEELPEAKTQILELAQNV